MIEDNLLQIPSQRMILFFLFSFFFLPRGQTSTNSLSFESFLSQYQKKNMTSLKARQKLSLAEKLKDQNTDFWQSRLIANPQMNFLDRRFVSGNQPDIYNRSQSIAGSFWQSFPTGTSLEVRGQKFLEVQNPLLSALDHSRSAKISQDLIRNSFGLSQRVGIDKARVDFHIAGLEYRQALVSACQEAFNLYTETYIQQEILLLFKSQLNDAKKIDRLYRRLYRNRLINKINKISSQSDFINTRLQVEMEEQKLLNNKRRMEVYLSESAGPGFQLQTPSSFLKAFPDSEGERTLTETLVTQQLTSWDFEVERRRSDRWTDMQLSLEVGDRTGRLGFGGRLSVFNENYLLASLKMSFDLINQSEDADLRNAIKNKNALFRQKKITEKIQKTRIQNLLATGKLIKGQVARQKEQIRLLKEKMALAFGQMKKARLDFEQYLLHKNAYLNQKKNFLNLQKDLWLNQFEVQKEFSHIRPQFCETPS